jgi:nucleoside diphosphate kinase
MLNEARGFNVLKAELMNISEEKAERHYGEHKALEISSNMIHASDSIESAEREIGIFFGQ